ncbi:MAG: hypothetical protein IAF02_01535 [Anaerolineae bacterium]|nr:hypothetical protein [Anaerolineae bacterium]
MSGSPRSAEFTPKPRGLKTWERGLPDRKARGADRLSALPLNFLGILIFTI